MNDALKMTMKGGGINVFAGNGESEIEANPIHYNELVVSGALDLRRQYIKRVLHFIESGTVAPVGAQIVVLDNLSAHKGAGG